MFHPLRTDRHTSEHANSGIVESPLKLESGSGPGGQAGSVIGLHYFERRTKAKELHSGPFLACPKMYDLYAICVAGLNRLIPRQLSESRLVYGQAIGGQVQ